MCLDYPDLGAHVYPAHVPAGFSDELPALYNSLCCTQEWFVHQDQMMPQGACVLDRPHHILLFSLVDGTIEVLNKAFDMSPPAAERVCTALFRAFPHAHRIHLEVMFPPDELSLPHRTLYGADHMYVRLPATVDEYRASLSKNMRKSLSYHQNRLKRDFPDVVTEIVPAGPDRQALFDTFLAWKTARFAAHGRSVLWQTDAALGEKFMALLALRGEAHKTSIAGSLAAVKFVFPVGDTIYSAQSAFDPMYEAYGLGLISSYWTICDAVERDMRRVGFMWGKEQYKERLGAQPRRATRISVFPGQAARLHSSTEGREVLRRNGLDWGTHMYWRTRREAGRIVRKRTGQDVTAPDMAARARDNGHSHRPASAPGPFRYADLRAEVHAVVDPALYGPELESLYGSLFATTDWFETHDDPPWIGACVLERPRHVILFTGKGDTVQVLNKAFEIPGEDVRRACHAFFRAFPHVRRIHFEVMCEPRDVGLPIRILYSTDHMIVDLPSTTDGYFASLGKSMRRNMRNYENRLKRDFPDLTTTVFRSDERSEALFAQFLEWKNSRFRGQGRSSYWESDPRLAGRFLALLARRGEVHVTRIGGKEAAILFGFPVGDVMCAQESAFNSAYDHYRLGLVTQYWLARDAVERGFSQLNTLWGSGQHKARFGAVPHRATALSIFRHERSRLWSADEAWEVGRRDATRRAGREYWRARHAARRAVYRVLGRETGGSSSHTT
jgi:CelD/BcsL family acetyltransferase involved in cellulose biosynthesis